MMSIQTEAERILALHDGSLRDAMAFLAEEHTVLQSRGQGLMGLAGVVVTVTGFSGRIIAGTGLLPQLAVCIGLALVVSSGIWMYAKVMRIHWMSRDLVTHAAPLDVLISILARRDRKTRAFQQGGFILCVGFAFYCLAVAAMLLSPNVVS